MVFEGEKLCKTYFKFVLSQVIFFVYFLTFICLWGREYGGVFSLDLLDICLDLVDVGPDLFHVEEELVHLTSLHGDGHILASDVILIRLILKIIKLNNSLKKFVVISSQLLIKHATMKC